MRKSALIAALALVASFNTAQAQYATYNMVCVVGGEKFAFNGLTSTHFEIRKDGTIQVWPNGVQMDESKPSGQRLIAPTYIFTNGTPCVMKVAGSK